MVFGLLFGLGGAFLGNLIGIGANLGFLIGSFIYSLFAKKEENIGGRALESLTINTDNADAPIPRGYGTFPCGIRYIWSAPVERITNREGGEDLYLTADGLLCEGPIIGIARVFADDELIADFSSNPDTTVSEGTELFLKHTTLYTGKGRQPADPFILDYLQDTSGLGYPTYPGMAHIVFKRYPLAQHGNRIPNWKFEVATAGSFSPSAWENVFTTYSVPSTFQFSARAQAGVLVYDSDGDTEKEVVILGGLYDDTTTVYDGDWRSGDGKFWELFWNSAHDNSITFDDVFNFTPVEWTSQTLLANGKISRDIIVVGFQKGTNTYFQFTNSQKWRVGYIYDNANRMWEGLDLASNINTGAGTECPLPRQNYGIVNWILPADIAGDLFGTALPTQIIMMTGGESIANGPNGVPAAGYYNGSYQYGDCWVSANKGLTWHVMNGTDASPGSANLGGYRFNHAMVIWQDVPYVIGGTGDFGGTPGAHNFVYKFSVAARQFVKVGDLNDSVTPSLNEGDVWGAVVNDVTNELYCFLQTSGQNMKVVKTDGTLDGSNLLVWTEVSLSNPPAFTENGGSDYHARFAFFNGRAYILGGEVSSEIVNTVVRMDFPSVAKNTVTLGNIYRTEAVTHCGISNALVNTDDIDAIAVTGFGIGQQQSTLDTFDQLNMAYQIKMVDDGEQLVFGRYLTHTGETLTEEDLGASNEFDELPNIVNIFTQQSYEIPLRVDVSYINADDLNTAVQSAPLTIQTGDGTTIYQNKTILKVSLSLVLSKDKARQIAYAILWNTLLARHQFPIHTTMRNVRFTPGDVLDIQTSVGMFTVRIVEAVLENMTIIRWTSYLENLNIYDSSKFQNGEIGVDRGTVGYPVAQLGEDHHFVNMTCLDDKRWDDWGFAYFASPELNVTSWLGSYLYMKSNDLDGYEQISDLINAITPIGTTVSVGALQTSPTIGIWDDVSELTIELTTEGKVLGNSKEGIYQGNLINHWLVGSEILVTARVEDLGSNQYRFYGGMLRGRYGTEDEVDNHSNGERVISLQDVLNRKNRIPLDKPFMGKQLTLKSVGRNQKPKSSIAETFTNTGLAKKPLSPCHITSRRDANNKWIIEWSPRARYNGNIWGTLPDKTTEPENKYVLEFYLNSGYNTLVFREQVTVPSGSRGYYEIDSARQDEEFGAVQGELYLKIYSLSSDFSLDTSVAYGNSDPVQITLGV